MQDSRQESPGPLPKYFSLVPGEKRLRENKCGLIGYAKEFGKHEKILGGDFAQLNLYFREKTSQCPAVLSR